MAAPTKKKDFKTNSSQLPNTTAGDVIGDLTERNEHDIGLFLDFLDQDMKSHPTTSIVEFPTELLDHAKQLTIGISVDLDEPLD